MSPLSFASLRARSLGRDKDLPQGGKARSVSDDNDEKPRGETNATGVAGVATLDTKKLAASDDDRNTQNTTSTSSEDNVIPFLRAHVSKFAIRDNRLGARVSAITIAYFVATALAPWLLTSRLSAAADALGVPSREASGARAAASVVLWAVWAVLRAAAYVRSFMLVRRFWAAEMRKEKRTRMKERKKTLKKN